MDRAAAIRREERLRLRRGVFFASFFWPTSVFVVASAVWKLRLARGRVRGHRVHQPPRVLRERLSLGVAPRDDLPGEGLELGERFETALEENAVRVDGDGDLPLERDALSRIRLVQTRHEPEPGGVVLASRVGHVQLREPQLIRLGVLGELQEIRARAFVLGGAPLEPSLRLRGVPQIHGDHRLQARAEVRLHRGEERAPRVRDVSERAQQTVDLGRAHLGAERVIQRAVKRPHRLREVHLVGVRILEAVPVRRAALAETRGPLPELVHALVQRPELRAQERRVLDALEGGSHGPPRRALLTGRADDDARTNVCGTDRKPESRTVNVNP